MVKKFTTPADKYGTPEQGFTVVCTTYRLTEQYHYWTKNNPMNVQLIPEPFVEIPVELADEMGIRGAEKIKVTSARGKYIAKAFVTRRMKPMTIDGKKVYQIGLPIHQGFRGIQEDAGKDRAHSRQYALADRHRSQRLHAGIQGVPREGRKGMNAMSQASGNQRISGHAGPVPGAGVKREYEVCKLIDTTTCIGCKACEVACLEWNGHSFSETVFDNTYQTMPETAWNYWNLIKFNEHEHPTTALMLLMRKDQCMHCEEPGCLIACPADGAIVQYVNGIVDFQQDKCIGCGYCMTGCPFNIPKFSPTAQKVFKCTLCLDRVSAGLEPACIKSCPTGCLHFGTKDDMKELAENRATQLREKSGFQGCGSLRSRPASAARTSFTCCTTRQIPKSTAACPQDPHVPWTVRLWKKPLKWLGNLAMIGGIDRRGDSLSALRAEGRRRRRPEVDSDAATGPGARTGSDAMSAATSDGVFQRGRVLRYTFHERLIHWIAGLSYMYLMLTGLAFWSPWLFWLAAIFGGGTVSRELHPWSGSSSLSPSC